jgi:predicted O-linked N-acetylglucosamine transferase (SPINDLY family)
MVSSAWGQNSAHDHFLKGKQLVEENCIDCMGGTQQGEEQGIRELEAALQAHYESPIDAYKLLANAYANMSTYVGKNASDANAFQNKEYGVYRTLYELAPNDEEVLLDYERTLTEDNDKIAIFRKVLTLNPKNAEARFSLADLLMQQDKIQDAMQEMKQAITLETNPESVRNYVQRLIEALDNHHCPLKNARIYNAQVLKPEEAATQGPGDPQPMAIFKTKFLAAMDQHACSSDTKP